eukprot:g2464.t1
MPRLNYEKPLDDVFKLNVMGSASSGKTSLCSMLCTSTFVEHYTHSKTRESFIASMKARIDRNRKINHQRVALVKKKDNTPLWSEKAWDIDEKKSENDLPWTIFGAQMRPLSKYYVELTDIPGSLDDAITTQEMEYVEEKGLWNHANCTFPRPSNRNQYRYDPMSEDDRVALRSYQSSRGSMYREATKTNSDMEPLLVSRVDKDKLPEPLKQACKSIDRKMNQLVELARITMGFIVVFDVTDVMSWKKAKHLIEKIMENLWVGSVRPPIMVFANMYDKLRRNDAGTIGDAFTDLQSMCQKFKMTRAFRNGSSSIEFAVGSVKDNQVSFFTKYLWSEDEEEGRKGKMPKLGDLQQFTLSELVHRVVSKKFDTSWSSQSSESKTKSGIVYQAYRHYETIQGGRASTEKSRISKRKKRSRRGCLQSTWIWAKCVVRNVVCCPCNCLRGVLGFCTGSTRSRKQGGGGRGDESRA